MKTREQIQASVLRGVEGALDPLTFEAVRGASGLSCEDAGFRDIDRALQALKRRGAIKYRKSQGTKGSHGWVLASAKESEDGR